MNTLAILIAIAANQLPQENVRDWLFMDAQERFVIESVRPEDRKKQVPEHIARCFDRLGSQYYKVRENASRDLLKMDRREIARWLFWGQVWNDPEVMLRCTTIIHKISNCEYCNGTGRIGEQGMWSMECKVCLGCGYYWPLGLLCDVGID